MSIDVDMEVRRLKAGREDATLAGRIKIGMAQVGIHGAAELGRKMKVNRQTVHRWITGEGTKLTPVMLFRLAEVLSVNPEWLAMGSPHSPVRGYIPSPEQAEVLEIHKALADAPNSAQEMWLRSGRDLVRLTTASPSNPFPVKRK